MRLIDADAFEVVFFENKSEEFVDGATYVLEMIDNAPTVDAQEKITELQMEKHDLTVELKSLEAIIADLEEKCDDREYGEWEVVHGVMTPGGDPLLRCPFCRSNERHHMGGIEFPQHWDFCPKCGADMRGGKNDF